LPGPIPDPTLQEAICDGTSRSQRSEILLVHVESAGQVMQEDAEHAAKPEEFDERLSGSLTCVRRGRNVATIESLAPTLAPARDVVYATDLQTVV
jgi:hypothetical protein